MLLLRSLLFQGLFLLWTTTVATLSLPLLALGQRAALIRVSRFWAAGIDALLLGVAGIRIRIEGQEHLPAGPYVLAAKHQSQWETSEVLRLSFNPAIVLKQELRRIPIYGWFTSALGMIPVDRDGGAGALKLMLRQARKAAEDGRVIVIFPQGTRTRPGEAAPYQPGVAAIYREAGLPVVPAALNSGFFWPKHGWRRPPGTIVLRYLPPIAHGLRREAFMAELEQRIETASAALEAETRQALGLAAPVDKPAP